MKTSELKGRALDWAVAKVVLQGKAFSESDRLLWAQINKSSSDWSIAGPIIEREEINLATHANGWMGFKSERGNELPIYAEDGSTPLIAAMRCFVASKLGDEVEVKSHEGTCY